MSNQSKKTSHPVLRSMGIFLLLLLLILVGGVGYLFIDTVAVDDPATMAAQPPMPASQRFVFDAAKETAQIKLEKSDLWWLLLPEMEENLLEDVNRELEKYHLSVTGYGLDITKKGVCIDLEAMYQSVRLPVHIMTSLDFDASGVSLTLTKAKLGLFRLPVGKLLNAVDERIDLDWPVVTDITDVTYQQDTILLTGTVTQDLLSCVREACQNDAIGWFSTSHQALFRAAREEEGFRELLPGLEQDPGSIEALYQDLFALSEVFEYEIFMDATRNLSHRLFPGIDYAAWETENHSVREEWTSYNAMVDKLVTQVSKGFNNRRFNLKNGEFYVGNSAFDVLGHFTGDMAQEMQQLFQVIDRDKFHLVLVGSINGYALKSPALNSICSKDQQLTQELNRKEAYPVGCVFQGINGEYFLRYESMRISGRDNQISKFLKTIALSEAEYDSLVQEGKIGVWIS